MYAKEMVYASEEWKVGVALMGTFVKWNECIADWERECNTVTGDNLHISQLVKL